MLLVDEPAAGLNAAEVDSLLDRIRTTAQRAASTVVLVEHNMDLVMNVADRIIVMDYGRHLFEGAPAEVQKNPGRDRGLSGRRIVVSALLEAESSSSPMARCRPAADISLDGRRRRDRRADRRQRRREIDDAARDRRRAAAARRARSSFRGEDVTRLPSHERTQARHRAGAGRPARLSVPDRARKPRARRLQVPQGRRKGSQRMIERIFAMFPRLRERSGQNAGTLSGGEQQMLVLGRAMMSEPRLLCLDEPSLGLAPMVVQDIFRTIRAINAAGTSVLLVEQNARYAFETASRGYVLQTGSIIASGLLRRAQARSARA